METLKINLNIIYSVSACVSVIQCMGILIDTFKKYVYFHFIFKYLSANIHSFINQMCERKKKKKK